MDQFYVQCHSNRIPLHLVRVKDLMNENFLLFYVSSSGNPSDGFFAFQGVVDHVTLWFQRENGQFASFDTTECFKPCYYDGKHDHLKIAPIIATIFDPGLNSPESLGNDKYACVSCCCCCFSSRASSQDPGTTTKL